MQDSGETEVKMEGQELLTAPAEHCAVQAGRSRIPYRRLPAFFLGSAPRFLPDLQLRAAFLSGGPRARTPRSQDPKPLSAACVTHEEFDKSRKERIWTSHASYWEAEEGESKFKARPASATLTAPSLKVKFKNKARKTPGFTQQSRSK